MAQQRKVVIAAPVHPSLTVGLQQAGYTCFLHEDITQESAPAIIADCVGIITSTRLQLDKELIDGVPGLEWIGRMGSGMEVIDVPYARSKGIACYGSPDGNCNAVAEHAVGLLLDLCRNITVSGNQVRQGLFLRNENRGIELEGRTIGIIGFGHTGRALAKKLSAFDMHILSYDKYNLPPQMPFDVTVCRHLDEIYEKAEIVSFHVPQQPDTYHYFNQEFIANMRRPFMLINTSRGQVVNTVDLLRGMNEGKIIGACLDVFEKEPLSRLSGAAKTAMDQLLTMPNVIVTPHIAGYTSEALVKMGISLLKQIVLQ